LPFPECHIVGIRHYVAFSDWLLSLSNMHLRFIHGFSWLGISFLFSYEYCFAVWMYHSWSFHLLKHTLAASKFWQLWIKCL
jgi:hypothetical protein